MHELTQVVSVFVARVVPMRKHAGVALEIAKVF